MKTFLGSLPTRQVSENSFEHLVDQMLKQGQSFSQKKILVMHAITPGLYLHIDILLWENTS